MKRFISFFIFCILTAVSCERMPLYDKDATYPLQVKVDWSLVEEKPSGMTIMFYPVDGSQPTKILTNSVDGLTVNLKENVYNVLLFNYSVEEFGSLAFYGMGKWDTPVANVVETKSNWYKTKAGDKIARQPEELAVSVLENLLVTDTRISSAETKAPAEIIEDYKTILFHPSPIIQILDIIIHLDGFQNMRSVRGSISGLASEYYLTTGQCGSSTSVHLLEQWLAQKEDSNSGTVCTSLTTFGLPDNSIGSGEGQTPIVLNLSFLLADGSTVVDHYVDITDLIHFDELTGKLEVRISDEINLPEVEIPDDSERGEGAFKIGIDDWGDIIDILVSM